MNQLDPFLIYRNALFVGLSVYATIVLLGSVAWMVRVLSGSDQRKRILRVYLSYHALTARWEPLAGELVQIGLLVAALTGIYHLHGWLDA